jgi:transcriptional regulator with XRE-family HTH domain
MQPMSPAERVAANVRAELARQRKSQTELAQALSLPQSAVSRRCVGRVPFDINELTIVARFLGVSLDLLLVDRDAESVGA